MGKQWTRREALWAMAGTGGLLPPNAERPNILFIMPDQLRVQALGYAGNEQIQTPYIDRLASESLVLQNTFANSPVCCPARANILTGKFAHHNGMVANDLRLRETEAGLAKCLRDQGYRTGFVGKWHLDGGKRMPGFVPPGPRRQGFEFWAANECSHQHFNTQYFRDRFEPIPIRKFEAEAWADLAIEFLRNRSDRRPFFLTVQMGPPHDPYQAPPEYRRLYDPQKLKMRPNWSQQTGLPGPREIAEYYGMVTALDEQVGRILHALDLLGLAENTIVLFSPDHGDMLGSQGSLLKRKPWEESIHVPGLLRYPGKIGRGRHFPGMFTHVDFAPTLLGLCNITIPAAMQGIDLSAALLAGKDSGPDSAFLQIFGPYQGDGTQDGWRGVRTHRYLYARYQKEPWLLYDLHQDPFQLKNLAADHGSKALLHAMEEKLLGWMTRTGDRWSYNWHEPVEDRGRLYRNEAFYSVEEYLAWAQEHPET